MGPVESSPATTICRGEVVSDWKSSKPGERTDSIPGPSTTSNAPRSRAEGGTVNWTVRKPGSGSAADGCTTSSAQAQVRVVASRSARPYPAGSERRRSGRPARWRERRLLPTRWARARARLFPASLACPGPETSPPPMVCPPALPGCARNGHGRAWKRIAGCFPAARCTLPATLDPREQVAEVVESVPVAQPIEGVKPGFAQLLFAEQRRRSNLRSDSLQEGSGPRPRHPRRRSHRRPLR